MTDHKDDINNELKAFLEGRDGVSKTFSKIEKPEIPSQLDRVILQAAREDDEMPINTGKPGSYFSQKYSIAASLVICVLIGAIYLTDRDILQPQTPETRGSLPTTDRLAGQPSAADDFAQAETDNAEAPQQAFIAEPEMVAERQEARRLAADATTSGQDIEEIVVTGSRIRTDGVTTPNPVTVVTLEEIQLANPEAIIDGLADLPQFRESGADEASELSQSAASELPFPGEEIPPNAYRSNPEAWAQHIHGLTRELAELTTGMTKTAGEDQTGTPAANSRTVLSGQEAETTNPVAANAAVPPEDTSAEATLRAQLELERREFTNAHPDISLDDMLQNLDTPE